MSKTKNYTNADWQKIKGESNDIFKEFAQSMEHDLNDDTVFKIVQKWQKHITQYYYDCSKEILSGLADMYVADVQFKINIDKHGVGLAEYMCGAIKEYCEK